MHSKGGFLLQSSLCSLRRPLRSVIKSVSKSVMLVDAVNEGFISKKSDEFITREEG